MFEVAAHLKDTPMADAPQFVLEERHGPVVLISLNQPDRYHVLSYLLRVQLAEAMDRAEADETVRAIVLTGTGQKAFCAGGDLKEMTDPALRPQPKSPEESRKAGFATERFRITTLPVVAAVNGVAYGGGASLATNCDIRLASATATFRFPGSEMGLVVGAAALPRLVGAARAKELIFTGRAFSAQEAYQWGFVNEVYAPDELVPRALEMAQTIAKGSAAAMREAKQIIDLATVEAERMQADANRRLRDSPEQAARAAAMRQKVTGS